MSLTDCQLFEAVEGGDCEKVKQLLLNQKVDVNQSPRHQDGSDPLIIACEFGNLEIVQFLFEKGSSLHPLSQTPKKTALSSVCEKGYFEIAKFLIEKGVKVDQTTTGGESPLWICCERRDFEMANLLIDNKAKVDWSTNEGETSFCCACKRGDFEMAQFLINKGANINFSLQDSWSPLCIAVLENDIKMVHFLLEKGAHPNIPSKDEISPWHIACQKGNLEIVKTFLKIKALHLDRPGNQGKTALHEAAEGGHFDIITLLVERGASINFLNQLHRTPFSIACKLGDLKIVSFFIKHGAQLQFGYSDGLVLACEEGHMDVISYLLENMKEELNVGPLCFASEKGKFDLAQFLISKNCPINGVHIQFLNQSPLTVAFLNNNLDIVELLLQNGAHLIVQGKSVLHQVCASKFVNLPVVKILVENGADVNGIYQGRTPLMALLNQTSIYGINTTIKEIVLFLLQNGVEINKTNEDGDTALHVAVHRGVLERVKLLCEHGADPEIKNNSGQTPADTTYSPVKKFLEKFLEEYGSIKPAKREGNEKIESNGKEEQREGEEEREEGEEGENKKRKIGDE